jgi:hypothetical protein
MAGFQSGFEARFYPQNRTTSTVLMVRFSRCVHAANFEWARCDARNASILLAKMESGGGGPQVFYRAASALI